MRGTFTDARKFNQNLNHWDVSKVEGEGLVEMFLNAHEFNGQLTSWDTSKVTSFYRMFKEAVKFNQPLPWNVSAVTASMCAAPDATARRVRARAHQRVPPCARQGEHV